MNDIEMGLIKQKDEVIKVYKDDRELLINGYEKSNRNLFIISIASLFTVIVTIIILSYTIVRINKSLYDFMNQYEYSSVVETETVTVDQDASDGGNVGYVGGDGDISYGETESSKSN